MAETQCFKEYYSHSWQEARERLLSIASECRKVLFRGQANSEWPLVSSLGRIVKQLSTLKRWNTESKAKFTCELENKLVKEFKEAYRRIPSLGPLSDENQNELIAFAQHYSLPTRFLDWSTSPYIAAFFAFDGRGTTIFGAEDSVAIWALNWQCAEFMIYNKYTEQIPRECASEYPDDFKDIMEMIRKDDSPRVDLVEIFGNPNRRLVFQQGLFTCAIGVEDDLKTYFQSNCKFAPGIVLTKIIIPGSVQTEALKDLSWMGINPAALMHDADSAAATAFNEVVRFKFD